MHITNKKLSLDIFTVGNLQNIFMEHDLNILMIFGIKEKSIILTIQCIFGYFYKYTPATYCFCAPGSDVVFLRFCGLWCVCALYCWLLVGGGGGGGGGG